MVSVYQILVATFQKFPHLKLDLTGHHGIIPFMDMLEIDNSQVSYLQQSFFLFLVILMCNHGI